MGIVEMLISILKSPWFWIVLAGIAYFYWKTISRYIPKLPVINKRNSFVLVTLLIGLMLLGVFGMLGFGSISSTGTSSIIGSQVTTNFATLGGGSVALSTITKNTLDLRMTNAQVNGSLELASGVIQFTRGGELKADSCNVRAIVPAPFYNQSNTDQNDLFHLIERDSLRVPKVYLNCGSSSAAATTSSPTEKTVMPFAEGVAVAYCGVAMEVDKTAHSAMLQYSSMPVVLDFCGERYTVNVFRM
jgi:hypothetical protein